VKEAFILFEERVQQHLAKYLMYESQVQVYNDTQQQLAGMSCAPCEKLHVGDEHAATFKVGNVDFLQLRDQLIRLLYTSIGVHGCWLSG
jgi:hypothetical protein